MTPEPTRCGGRSLLCQSRFFCVMSPSPPSLKPIALPAYPAIATPTLPPPSGWSATSTSLYARSPAPSPHPCFFPVFGSYALTRCAMITSTCSRPSTLVTSGVLHDPIQSPVSRLLSSAPPGSSVCQRTSPVFLSIAHTNCLTP